MTETVVIIDYGSGNLRSVEKAFERASRESGLSRAVSVSDDPERIAAADRIVLPGVGAFGACMDGLSARSGVMEALEHAVLVNTRPFLGICVGMQLLAEYGREFGTRQGLGWIPGEVRAIEVSGDLTTPHMGWNTVAARIDVGPLAATDGGAFYFAHSFHFAPENDAHLIGVTHHGGAMAAAVGRDNILGVQFHPEKSQSAGLQLIGDFLRWGP